MPPMPSNYILCHPISETVAEWPQNWIEDMADSSTFHTLICVNHEVLAGEFEQTQPLARRTAVSEKSRVIGV